MLHYQGDALIPFDYLYRANWSFVTIVLLLNIQHTHTHTMLKRKFHQNSQVEDNKKRTRYLLSPIANSISIRWFRRSLWNVSLLWNSQTDHSSTEFGWMLWQVNTNISHDKFMFTSLLGHTTNFFRIIQFYFIKSPIVWSFSLPLSLSRSLGYSKYALNYHANVKVHISFGYEEAARFRIRWRQKSHHHQLPYCASVL